MLFVAFCCLFWFLVRVSICCSFPLLLFAKNQNRQMPFVARCGFVGTKNQNEQQKARNVQMETRLYRAYYNPDVRS